MGFPPHPTFRDEALQAAFEADGFVVVDLLEPSDVARLASAYDAYDDAIKALPFSVTVMSESLDYRLAVDRAIRATIAERVENILCAYRYTHGGFFVKHARRAEGRILMHQDPTFVDETRFLPLVLWAPLVDVTPTTACLRVIPGSHRLNPIARCSYGAFPYRNLESEIDARYGIDVPMRAGEVLLFNPALFHSSRVHDGDRVRVVAGSLLIPRAANYVYHYRADGDTGEFFEQFDVPDDFYLTHVFGRRPDGLVASRRVAESTAPLTLERVDELCGPRRRLEG